MGILLLEPNYHCIWWLNPNKFNKKKGLFITDGKMNQETDGEKRQGKPSGREERQNMSLLTFMNMKLLEFTIYNSSPCRLNTGDIQDPVCVYWSRAGHQGP